MRRTKYSESQWGEAIGLMEDNIGNKEISEKTGIPINSVKSKRYLLFGTSGLPKKDINELIQEIAHHRMTMTVLEVGRLLKKCPKYINKLMKDHPDSDKFFVDTKTIGQKISERITESRKNVKKSEQFKKGYAKTDSSKQTEVSIKNSGPKRKVKINSNTEIFVPLDDKRTDAQVIEDFKRKFNK